jgi:hypothetical protein
VPQGKKYLWVNWDEKWFWGLVCRSMAKAISELGVNKKASQAYHKRHINKVMYVAVVGYAFEGSPLTGGDGVKIAFQRVESIKKAKRTTYNCVTIDGVRSFPHCVCDSGDPACVCNRVREPGDFYATDTNICGSNSGTSDDPIIQGDQASPHTDGIFLDFVREFCEARGWYWSPQAPQMPHMNVLDLSVFPAMSKRHSGLTRKHGYSVVSQDVIAKCAEKVFNDFSSATIARSFVTVRHMADKVIAAKGGNEFLAFGDLHFGIRATFADTDTGIRLKHKEEDEEEDTLF